MSLTLVSSPSAEPITLAEAKRQCRLASTQGEPAPTALAAALAGAGAGNVDNGAHRYGVTFVTAAGETELGTVSDAVTVADKTVNGRIALTNIALGGSAVTSRKVYRTVAGGSTYLLLTTIADNTTSTYTDNIADASLGAQAPSTNTTEDPELTSAIQAAREEGEDRTGRAFITQSWDWIRDDFGGNDYLEIPKPPLQSITYVKYRDTAGTLQTWDVANYVVEAPSGPRCRRGRLSLAYGKDWPQLYGQAGDVQIRFVCGYGAAASAVPAQLRRAMLVRVATHYRHREDVITGTIAKMPDSIASVYARHFSHATQRRAA